MTDVAPSSDPSTNGQAPGPGQTQGQQGPGFRVLAQYVRDLSFENPKAPDSLRIEGKPQIDMGVELGAQGRPDGLFEVDLKLSIKASSEGAAVFQVELVYAGLFQLSGIAEADLEPMLLIECPRYLFPYAREIVSRATADGGFYPPFMMDPLDFQGIYLARQQQMAAPPAGEV